MLLIELSQQQKAEEKDSIVLDLFGRKITSVKGAIEQLDAGEKEFMVKKIRDHSAFFKRIIDENPEKPSFRIEIARFRVNTLYPQILKALGYEA